jgi:RecG-like helicase
MTRRLEAKIRRIGKNQIFIYAHALSEKDLHFTSYFYVMIDERTKRYDDIG